MGRVGGIEIGANWTWQLFPALLVWSVGGAVFPSTNPGLATGTCAAMARAAAPLFFVSIVLHELGHARQARRERSQVGGITLWALDGRVAGFLDAADVLRRARRGRPAPVAG
jgi:Zn-dependent protease